MKPGAPWSVKGIKPEARETAKSAARRAGMTLGEWLNQTIRETGAQASRAADVASMPENRAFEAGNDTPWTGPLEAISADLTTRLAKSESKNEALLTSLEMAIGGISEKLLALDKAETPQGITPSALEMKLEARLENIEAKQNGALSKDHLRSLETAVGQISVVLDNQSGKNKAALKALGETQGHRIDQSHTALVDLAAHLEQTESRVNHALSAVEAASDLYDITDRQGQIVDSLVMDVAAVQAEQKTAAQNSSAALAALSDDMRAMRAEMKSIADQSSASSTVAVETAGEEAKEQAKLAIDAVAAQSLANEERTASSIVRIEQQIASLSGLLDRSLLNRQSGAEEASTALAEISRRVEDLEIPPHTATRPEQPAIRAEPEPEIEATIGEAEPHDLPDTVKAPVTFTNLAQQSAKNVHVKMAIAIEPDFERYEPVVETQSQGVDQAADQSDEIRVEISPVDVKDGERLETDAVEETTLLEIEPDDMPEGLPEDLQVGLQAARQTDPGIFSGDGSEETAAAPEQGPEPEVNAEDETARTEPLLFEDIFGESSPNPVSQTLMGEGLVSQDEPARPEREGDADLAIVGDSDGEDNDKVRALKEAVTNISSMRASWAAKNEADGKPGSIRQIVEVGDEETKRRDWVMTGAAATVALIAVTGMLMFSGQTSDLIDTRERPGLFDQITSWGPGGSKPAEDAIAPGSADLPVILANLPAGLEEAALAGDARAQFALGRAFANGDDRPVDRSAALKWYGAAADQDLAIAQYVLGSLHERGIDVAEDKKKAMDLYAAAAKGGNRRSMHNLAVAYARGDVIDQDLAQAAYWFSEAAQLGLSDAQYNLALLHERGLGVERDIITAVRWYRIAAANGDTAATAQADRLGEKLNGGQTQAAASFATTWAPRDMEPVANGLFDISPGAWDKAGKRSELATVQSRLMSLGYTLTGKDGIMDPATRKAIEKFEASQDLKITGKLSPGLSESLTAPRNR
jgi:localization factor PodJL